MNWSNASIRKPGTLRAYTPDDIQWQRSRGELPYAAKYLDGDIHQLIPGEHFVKLASFRARLWQLADRLGRRVRTRMQDGYLFVQALDMDGNPKPGCVVVPPTPLPAPKPSGSPQEQPQAADPGQVEV